MGYKLGYKGGARSAVAKADRASFLGDALEPPLEGVGTRGAPLMGGGNVAILGSTVEAGC